MAAWSSVSEVTSSREFFEPGSSLALDKSTKGEVVFRRHTVRLKLKTEKGRSGYLCNYGLCFVGRCSGRALSFLCPIPSYQTRLTPDQPAKGCEVGSGTKNESISVYGSCRPAAAQLFERNAVVVGSDSTRVECLVEGPVQ
ncbi:unnamed protein product [Dovyalis caffra]|uniref:Uncharacterized protein n=1 Tax=Dovyalis caffra TaxID=77055 RepID=A0AAV1R762_9ROSI|nr:unnamed protein product [Dovyalis caffra]CAK7328739.1 unnamed protein product [Dovyalis caffra]CAK7328760.1 unnamed protein product [Dovyalis caffra]